MTDDIVTRLHRHDHDWLPDVHTPCDYCDALHEILRLRAAGDAMATNYELLLDDHWSAFSAAFLSEWKEARRD